MGASHPLRDYSLSEIENAFAKALKDLSGRDVTVSIDHVSINPDELSEWTRSPSNVPGKIAMTITPQSDAATDFLSGADGI